MSKIGYTFNWFYVDNKHTAYFNSGADPVRDKARIRTSRPGGARRSTGRTSTRAQHRATTPPFRHPQAIDQDYFTSWNNKQAPGYRAADSMGLRADLPLQAARPKLVPLIKGKKDDAAGWQTRWRTPAPSTCAPTRAAVRAASCSASRATRGGAAVAELRAWYAAGAHRMDRNRDGVYENADAIRIMDAWWPRAGSTPSSSRRMGRHLLSTLSPPTRSTTSRTTTATIWDRPIRRAATATSTRTWRAAAPRGQAEVTLVAFCGHGGLAACRKALEFSLKQALGRRRRHDTYPGPTRCARTG